MTDPQILTTLRSKKAEIESVITRYEKALKAAQTDLMHVKMTLCMFEVDGVPTQFPVHISLARAFRKNELPTLCLEALAASPAPLDTRELAIAVARAKGMDETDKVLRHSIAQRIHNALRPSVQRGKLAKVGKRSGAVLWRVD